MYHTLECMRISLMIERQKGQVRAYFGFMIDMLYSNFTMQAHNTMLVVQELEGDAEDSRVFEQSYHSFFDLPQNDEGRNVSSRQTSVGPLPQYGDYSEGLSSASTSKQVASQLPTPPLAVEPETPHSAIFRVAHPCTVTRTPSPLSSFGSSLQISSHYSPQYYSQLAQLTATQLAIVSSLDQLQGDAIYGVWITDVYERVTQVIEITKEEFSTDIEWLLEEIYIFRPLDDGRIALTPRASA
ncbi:hypothetical protein BDR05DRAFT_955652 [Suillus weaverae]|nr:hypothetical protein BDR05DRAFT_955652 [Suillus weaverae]